jgi:hypothetical protein
MRRASLSLLFLLLCGFASKTEIVRSIEKLGDSPTKFTLYSLDPGLTRSHDKSVQTTTLFHGHHILGQTEISDAKERRTLAQALARGASESDSDLFNCFEPRHGLHIEQSGRSVDFVICFECRRVHAYGFPLDSEFQTSASPQPVFDDFLRRHHLPLAPK